MIYKASSMFLDYGVLGSLGAIRPTRRFVMGCREGLRFRGGGGFLRLGDEGPQWPRDCQDENRTSNF